MSPPNNDPQDSPSDFGWVLGAAAVAASAALGATLHWPTITWLLLAASIVGLCLAFPHRRMWALTALVALLAAFGAQRTTEGLQFPSLPMTGRWMSFSGIVVEDPRPSQWSTDVVVSIDSTSIALPGSPATFRAQVRAGRNSNGRLLGLDRGDRIEGTGVLSRANSSFLESRHVGTRLRLQTLDHVYFDDAWWSPIMGIRREAVRAMEVLPGGSGPLLAGFVFGDTRRVDSEVQDTMRAAGLGHMFAVSGANVTFVLAGMAPILMWLPKRSRLLLSLLIIWIFVLMTGATPSVLRAGVMLSAALIDRWIALGRHRVRGLAGAVTLCILVDPYLVRSLGFALSVAATAGIVGLTPWLASRLGGGTFAEAIAPTFAAQLCTAPLLALAGLNVPLAGIAANLWGAVLVGPITLGGIMLAVCSRTVPWFAPPLRLGMLALVRAFEGGAAHFAKGAGWSLGLIAFLVLRAWRRTSVGWPRDGAPRS